MSEHLVIRLDSGHPDRVTWVFADSGGERASLAESGTLADASRQAQQRPVTVLVPGQEVLLTRVRLPVRGMSRMLQAVPYALEEQLAENVSNMHFALGTRDASGSVTVAAVRDSLMQEWIGQLDAAGLEASLVLPDTAAVPPHDGVSILIDGASFFVRDSEGQVLAGDTESAGEFISAIGLDDQTTASTQLYISQTDATRYSQVLSEIRIILPDTTVVDLRHGALPLMAATALQTPQPNLLQGAYARSSGREKLLRPWRAAALFAGIFILVALGGKALEVMSLKSELRALNTELNNIASEALDGGRVVDPLLQLEQLASSLNGGASGTSTEFLDMLDSLSQALTTAGNTTLEKLNYRNGTMDLTLTAPSVDTLDKISRDIGSTGYSAVIQSAKQEDDVILGRLLISGQPT